MCGDLPVKLAVNIASATLVHAGHEHSLNQRGAYVHVLSDALGALGALVAAGIILATGRTIADPAISTYRNSILIRGLISLPVLLNGAPS